MHPLLGAVKPSPHAKPMELFSDEYSVNPREIAPLEFTITKPAVWLTALSVEVEVVLPYTWQEVVAHMS